MINRQSQEQLQKRKNNNNRVKTLKETVSKGEEMLLEKAFVQNIEVEFHFRPAEMDDVEAAAKLFETCSYHMIGKNEVKLADVRSEWLLPDFDLESSTLLVVRPDEEPVGYIEVWDIAEMPVRVWVWGRVHPNYEGRGIGTYLMRWAEERARQAINKVPGDLRVTMQSGSYSTYKPAHELFHNLGMDTIRHFYTMAKELDTLPVKPIWPNNNKIRTMTGVEEARDVVWAIEDAFQDHWGFVEQPFEQEYQRWLHYIEHDEDYDPTLWFLAMAGDQIAGMALCHEKSNEDPEMGWVNVLGVRRPWRKQGLGLALLNHSFGEFYRRGKARAGLGVDAGSLTGATRLYEKAGMKPIRQFTVSEKELRHGRIIATTSVE